MAAQHDRSLQALRSGRPHVVRVEDLDHRGAHHPRDHGDAAGRQRRRRQDKMQQRRAEGREIACQERIDQVEPRHLRRLDVDDAKAPADRQQVEFLVEDRSAGGCRTRRSASNAAHRQESQDVVDRLTASYAGDQPHRQADDHDQDHRAERQFHAGRQELRQVLHDRPAIGQRHAEIAVQQAVQIDPELRRNRSVEPIHMGDGAHLFGRGMLTRQQAGRIAGHDMGQGESDDGHAGEHKDHEGQPPQDEGAHLRYRSAKDAPRYRSEPDRYRGVMVDRLRTIPYAPHRSRWSRCRCR